MKSFLLSVLLLFLSITTNAQKEVIIGESGDINHLILNGLDHTDAIRMDNGKVRIRHSFDFLLTERDFLRIFLDSDNNQGNANFSLYKDTTQGGSLFPEVQFNLDGYDSWINSGNFGIGDITPEEKLTVNGAIKIGASSTNTNGVIRYQNGAFQGHANGTWRSLTQDADSDPNNELQDLILNGYSLKLTGSNTVTLPHLELRDADNDTYISAEYNTDDDKITVGLGNQTRMNIAKTTGSGRTYLNFPNNGNNIMIGASGSNIASTGTNNTYIGGLTGTFNASGNDNVMIGRNTGVLNNQNDNVYIGNGVATLNESSENVFIGKHAVNTGSISNSVVIGHGAGSDADGNLSVYIGHSSGPTAGGIFNTFVGYDTGQNFTHEHYNTLIGAGAGGGLINGGNNTHLGAYAGGGLNNGSNNTFVGVWARADDSTSHNVIALGNEAVALASHEAMIGSTTMTSIGGYESWSNFSDGRFKSKIKEDVPGLIFVNQLRPVTYHLEASALDASINRNNPKYAENKDAEALATKEQIVYSGFIAQEVEASALALGYDFSGVEKPKHDNDYYALRYAMFTVPLVKAVQELSAQNDLLTAEVENLKAENASLQDELKNRISALENQLSLMAEQFAQVKQ